MKSHRIRGKINGFRRQYGRTKIFVFLPDFDRQPTDRCFLSACYGNPVTAIQATVAVTDVATTGCLHNPEATVAWATLGRRFFGSAAAGSEGEGRDMVALIGIIGVSDATGPPAGLQVRALVFYCANRLCTAGMELHRRDLGAVQRGERVRLRVQWDRDQHQFIFQRDNAPEVFAPYAVSDTAPPSIAVKLLDALMLVPTCTATPRPMAFLDAWFDDVMVNESAALRIER